MGVWLREALRMLCKTNRWSYAVFWKIGCQNTTLLIWEDCYHEASPRSVPANKNPELPFGGWEGCFGSEVPSSQIGTQSWDRVHMLINKMMTNNRVNLIGQGMVGRSAFTGSHQWIIASNFTRDTHPPEVLNEVHLQFSAGMQTVAVIPVLPHGVVQFGCSLPIVEDVAFINSVKSLIQQLGCIPGALLSNSYGTNECSEKIGIPISLETPVSIDPSGIYGAANSVPLMAESCNQLSNPSESSRLVGMTCFPVNQIRDSLQANATASQLPGLSQTLAKPHEYYREPKISPEIMSSLNLRGHLNGGVVGAEVIPSNPSLWLNQQALLYNQQSGFNSQPVIGQSSASHAAVKSMEQLIVSNADLCDNVTNNMNESNSQGRPTSFLGSVLNPQKLSDINPTCTVLSGIGLQNVNSSRAEVPLSILVNRLTASSICPENSQVNLAPKKETMDSDLFQALNLPLTHSDGCISLNEQLLGGGVHDSLKLESGTSGPGPIDAKYEDCIKFSGDDLFDILGADLKKTLLNGKWSDVQADGGNVETQRLGKDNSRFGNTLGGFSENEGISDRNMHHGIGTDHLLDAVVSSSQSASKQISDDDVSVMTTSTKISSSSIPSSSPIYGRVNMSDQAQGQLPGLQSLTKAALLASSSYQSGCSKDDTGTCSQTTSVYGSQISSWVERSQNSRRDTKKNDEITKPNRKRLKPGENPRPRPKDRQMIQDRVKELREIVPNGAKCSIDALLEKTIKHMLFLQSVTKHADKLKHTGEPKIVNNKDGEIILKDNFEGGATWAFEVGSPSMVCPIIVEDLNPPRQMLVEMICEDRGFFLEIADLIRGMGLTILKGVMETRHDKIWARFAVEASRDVTRMEIFMSLVHLLDQTAKGCVTPASASDSNSMMIHHSFPQAASIPATGRASGLQ
ncbi:hypothetical protein SLA2020_222670 [Shorea laevis]